MRQTLRLPLPSASLNRILARPSASASNLARTVVATPRLSNTSASPSSHARNFSTGKMSLLRSNLFNSPFDDFDVFPSTFRDLMVNPWPQLMSRGGPTPAVFQGERMWSGPRIDLHEEDTRFVLTAELPGVKKEDIKINVDADRRRLTLEGHMRSEYTSPTPSEGAAKSSESGSKPSAGESKASSTTTSQAVTKHDKGETRVGHPLVSERVFGQFARSFTLPPTANLSDDTALKARFHDGLLKLEIPKKAEEHSKTRQIAIESA